MSILKYNKSNNHRYMQYRRKTFTPVLDVIDEINFESLVDELLLVRNKIYQKHMKDNNKLTLYERALMCEINFWNRNWIKLLF
jgi:hypothetical protein